MSKTANSTSAPPARYSSPAIGLHWLIALLIIAGWSLGWVMTDLPMSPTKLRYYSWHKWMGVTVFALAWLRIFWRLTHTPPALPASTPDWQAKASTFTHGLLYVLLFAVPLSGWLYSSSAGFQTVYLGLVPIPDLLGKNKELADLLKEVHEWLTKGLFALVALHVAAALKHQFVDRDGLLRRMWF